MPGPWWQLARAACAGLAMCGLASPLPAQEAPTAEAPAPDIQVKEYFHQQNADAALMIRLEAFEAGFESRVFDPEGVLLKASALPSLRLGPVFQFIEPVDRPRQIRIEVSLAHTSSRSKIDMRLLKFDQGGPDSTKLMRAYRMLSHGLEIEKTNRVDNWTLKVVSLMQAAGIFDFLGMQELQLWSEFYANHYLLVILGDPLTAMEGAREIYPAALRVGLKSLALASLQMEGSALVKLAMAGDGKPRALQYEQAQARFGQAAEMAAAMDFQYERALAIYNSGLAFEFANEVGKAFAQFDQALGIATGAGNTGLANQIRQHAAALHESRGETTEAIALLQAIGATAPPRPEEEPAPEPSQEPIQATGAAGSGSPPAAGRSEREMVSYLFEQGRLLEKTFQHLAAAEVLQQALELGQGLPSATHTGPVMLLLAKALYGAGQMDAAAQYLQEATATAAASRYKSELEEAYGILANIQREKGDLTAMAAARERQQVFITSPAVRAAYTFERARDALAPHGASGGAGAPEARSLLAESEQLARESGAAELARLAVLQACALGDASPASNAACSGDQARQALAALDSSGLPALAAQGRLLWSQVLRRSGQLSESTSVLDRLIEDMRFFQAHLPGVLGAWYWQNRQQVFGSFMDQTLQLSGAPGAGAGDEAAAIRALAVLDRLSRVDDARGIAAAEATAGSEDLARLRSLYAARAAETDPQLAKALGQQADALLKQTLSQAAKTPGHDQDLAAKLRSLPPDAAFLAYYLADNTAYAWLGRKDGLQLIKLPWPENQSAELSRTIEGLRWDLSQGKDGSFVAAMDGLGQLLLAPIARQLPATVYFLPTGRLEGLPLDALRVDGAFMAERHRLINLVSLDALDASVSPLESDDLQHFYLAGNRQASAGDFAVQQSTSAEIRTIADLFVGPGLRIVQGSALHWNEFQDEQFTQAGVLHLAMPCVMDLRQPGESRLLLSDNLGEAEKGFLQPGDIAGKSFQARLVVLSACEFSGSSPSAFDINTRFVREFLQAGAGAVITSLWPVGDERAAEFWGRFYRAITSQPIASKGDVAEALYQTKKSYIGTGGLGQSGVWAAFQLFAD